jgi:sarcosine oxidase subunit delta
MLLVPCPHCGARDESEFVCHGEHRPRPDAALATDEWVDAVFMRKNARGLVEELWFHKHGCRQWFRLRRDTARNRFVP